MQILLNFKLLGSNDNTSVSSFGLGGFFKLDNNVKHLILETFLRDHKVKESNLNTSLWRVMRSRHLGSNEEFKVHIVVDRSLVKVNEVISSSLLDLSRDDRLKHGVKGLSSIYKDDGVS